MGCPPPRGFSWPFLPQQSLSPSYGADCSALSPLWFRSPSEVLAERAKLRRFVAANFQSGPATRKVWWQKAGLHRRFAGGSQAKCPSITESSGTCCSEQMTELLTVEELSQRSIVRFWRCAKLWVVEKIRCHPTGATETHKRNDCHSTVRAGVHFLAFGDSRYDRKPGR